MLREGPAVVVLVCNLVGLESYWFMHGLSTAIYRIFVTHDMSDAKSTCNTFQINIGSYTSPSLSNANSTPTIMYWTVYDVLIIE